MHVYNGLIISVLKYCLHFVYRFAKSERGFTKIWQNQLPKIIFRYGIIVSKFFDLK